MFAASSLNHIPAFTQPSPQVRLADVKFPGDQRRVETPPRVLMKTRAAADRAARAAAAAANGDGAGQANNRSCIANMPWQDVLEPYLPAAKATSHL